MKGFDKVAFSLVCFMVLGFHQFYSKLDTTSLGLALLAVLPWLVPLVAPMVATMKFAGMELTFREMKQQIEANTQVSQAAVAALATGVGRAPVVASSPAKDDLLSHSIPKPKKIVEIDEVDPNLGLFGRKSETGGRKLSAEVKSMPGTTELFLVHIWVSASSGGSPLSNGTIVKFHLHPTFSEPVVPIAVTSGIAALDRLAWGAFTVGAEVEGVKLELNLATDVAAPDLFRNR